MMTLVTVCVCVCVSVLVTPVRGAQDDKMTVAGLARI